MQCTQMEADGFFRTYITFKKMIPFPSPTQVGFSAEILFDLTDAMPKTQIFTTRPQHPQSLITCVF